jgi:hypothetical protein
MLHVGDPRCLAVEVVHECGISEQFNDTSRSCSKEVRLTRVKVVCRRCDRFICKGSHSAGFVLSNRIWDATL